MICLPEYAVVSTSHFDFFLPTLFAALGCFCFNLPASFCALYIIDAHSFIHFYLNPLSFQMKIDSANLVYM
jgi:hypothetical protein